MLREKFLQLTKGKTRVFKKLRIPHWETVGIASIHSLWSHGRTNYKLCEFVSQRQETIPRTFEKRFCRVVVAQIVARPVDDTDDSSAIIYRTQIYTNVFLGLGYIPPA